MRKPPSIRKQAVRRLRVAIRESRKLARQINRKLASLEQWKKEIEEAKKRLVDLGQKRG